MLDYFTLPFLDNSDCCLVGFCFEFYLAVLSRQTVIYEIILLSEFYIALRRESLKRNLSFIFTYRNK